MNRYHCSPREPWGTSLNIFPIPIIDQVFQVLDEESDKKKRWSSNFYHLAGSCCSTISGSVGATIQKTASGGPFATSTTRFFFFCFLACP